MPSPLRVARVLKDLSQESLADLAGVPRWRVSLLERGVIPKDGEAKAIADTLGVAPEKLFPKRHGDFIHTILSETEEGNARSEG